MIRRKKKVLVVANSTWYLFNFRKALISQLRASDIDVVALAPTDSYIPHLESLGIKHIALPMAPRSLNPLGELNTVWQMYNILKREKPDVLFSFTVKCNLYAGLCRFFARFHHVANISGLGESFEKKGLLSLIVSTLYRVALRKTARVFFQNEEDLKYCVRLGLVRESNSQRIPGSGVDLERFKPRRQANRNDNTTIFLMFGRLIPKKGYDLYIDAARTLVAKYGDRVQFTVMGIPDKTRIESRLLHDRVIDAEREGVVRLLPPSDTVEHLLSTVDCVVLPSDYNEGVPRSLLEGLASGKVIVTTDWKGCRDTVIDGANGYLVPINDVQRLCQALEKVAMLSTAELASMGAQSRRLAEDRFDEKAILALYMNEVAEVAVAQSSSPNEYDGNNGRDV